MLGLSRKAQNQKTALVRNGFAIVRRSLSVLFGLSIFDNGMIIFHHLKQIKESISSTAIQQALLGIAIRGCINREVRGFRIFLLILVH